MASRLEQLLVGGLPALIDGYSPQTSTPPAQQATPEEIPPRDNSGRDNANPPGNFLMTATSQDILLWTALIVGAIGLYAIVRDD